MKDFESFIRMVLSTTLKKYQNATTTLKKKFSNVPILALFSNVIATLASYFKSIPMLGKMKEPKVRNIVYLLFQVLTFGIFL